MPQVPYDALLVLTFGGPEGPADVLPFLANVTRGREVPAERLAEVAKTYQAVGGVSPIQEQSRDLVAAIGAELGRSGPPLPVYWGTRNWLPRLSDVVAEMAADGVRRALVFVPSAYSSYSGCRQYLDDLAAARAVVGTHAPVLDKLRVFFDHPLFIARYLDATRAALESLPPGSNVVFTAHSIPVGMARAGDYEVQLAETARLVAEAAGVSPEDWWFAWQSRSGPPHVPWLTPDIGDRLGELAERGVPGVAVVPIGFLSDHMEVVHDLDVVARLRALELGLAWARAATPGSHPEFVALVVELVRERTGGGPRRSLSGLPPRPEPCALGCCSAGLGPPLG